MKNPNASPILRRGFGLSSFGRSDTIRTCDILLPKQARYQLSVRNIVALLAWSASHCSVFLPAQSLPSSATGGGNARATTPRRGFAPHNKKHFFQKEVLF